MQMIYFLILSVILSALAILANLYQERLEEFLLKTVHTVRKSVASRLSIPPEPKRTSFRAAVLPLA